MNFLQINMIQFDIYPPFYPPLLIHQPTHHNSLSHISLIWYFDISLVKKGFFFNHQLREYSPPLQNNCIYLIIAINSINIVILQSFSFLIYHLLMGDILVEKSPRNILIILSFNELFFDYFVNFSTWFFVFDFLY